MSALLRAVGVARTYATSPPVTALKGVDLDVYPGERIAVVGRSGSGKSTLLNVLGLLDIATQGHVELLGRDTKTFTGRERDEARARTMGFVFQEAHVLGHRTVLENLQIKLAVNRVPRRDRNRIAASALEQVSLDHRAHALGRLLSGGEKQRLAVARATITGPALILADEPTGNLDAESARTILDLFDRQVELGVGVVVITHDARIAAWADRVVRLSHGVIEGDDA